MPMIRNSLRSLVPVLAVCALGEAALAQGVGIQVKQSGVTRTYTCQGNGVDSVQVTGSGDVLTVVGHCGALQVTGSGNNVTIDAVSTIQFTSSSNGNTIAYHGSRPTVSDLGTGNSATSLPAGQAAAGADTSASGEAGTTVVSGGAIDAAMAAARTATAAAGPVTAIQDQGNVLNLLISDLKTTQDCGDGKAVNINGNRNDITLTGSCGHLSLNGRGNTVHVAEVAAIDMAGHDNTLTWERGRNGAKPAVQIVGGADNRVRHVTAGGQ
jgi:hypothetical protein